MKNTSLRIKPLVAACSLILVSLVSCVDIKTDVEVNADGSGTITLTYTALRALVNMGTVDEENRFYAIPISEEDFENTADGIDGLGLRSFDLAETVDTVTVEANLDFESAEALSSFFSSAGPGAVEITDNGDTTTYRQLIYGGSVEEINADSREFIETFFSDYTAIFTLEAPEEISAVNMGEFSGRVAELEMGMTEILLSSEQLAWEVEW